MLFDRPVPITGGSKDELQLRSVASLALVLNRNRVYAIDPAWDSGFSSEWCRLSDCWAILRRHLRYCATRKMGTCRNLFPLAPGLCLITVFSGVRIQNSLLITGMRFRAVANQGVMKEC